jgi:hypothetical protein
MSRKTTERERRNWLNKPDISVNGPIIMSMKEEGNKKKRENSFLISLYTLFWSNLHPIIFDVILRIFFFFFFLLVNVEKKEKNNTALFFCHGFISYFQFAVEFVKKKILYSKKANV